MKKNKLATTVANTVSIYAGGIYTIIAFIALIVIIGTNAVNAQETAQVVSLSKTTAEYSGMLILRNDGAFKERPERGIHALKVQQLLSEKFRVESFAQYGRIWRNAIAGGSYQLAQNVWIGAGGGISIHRNHLISRSKDPDTGIKTERFENGEEYSTQPSIAGFVDAQWKMFRLIGNIDHSKNTYRYYSELQIELDEKVSLSTMAVRSAGIGVGLNINIMPHVTLRPAWMKSADIYATNLTIGIVVHSKKHPAFIIL